MVQKHHYSPCWTFSSVHRFLPEALKHSASLWAFPTFNIYHHTYTVSHHPLLAFTFSFHPFCVFFFFVTYHQTYWILHDRPFWWGGRQKRHALKAGAGSHFSQRVVGNLQSFPGFWPTPLSQPCPPSAHLYFVKTLQKVPWGQKTLLFYVLKRQKFLVFLSPTESFSVTRLHPSLLHLTVVSIDRPQTPTPWNPWTDVGCVILRFLQPLYFCFFRQIEGKKTNRISLKPISQIRTLEIFPFSYIQVISSVCCLPSLVA